MNSTEEKKWQRRRDARPAELIDAAFELFSEQGFAKTRLEDVAKRAGVSKATIYRYFDNKEALFGAMVQAIVTPRFHQAELLVDAFEGTSEDLFKTFFRLVKGALDGPFPPMIKLVISESGNFPELGELWVEMVVRRIFGIISRIIERGITRGEFREVEPSVITPLVGAPVLMLAVMRQTFAPGALPVDPDRVLEAHLDLLLRALRLDPETSALTPTVP